MPIYEYECKCGHTESIFSKLSDADGKLLCEKCNCPMRRIISLSHFKVNGFSEANGYSKTKES